MVRDIGGIRVCIHEARFRVFTHSSIDRFEVSVDLGRLSCGLWIGSTIIAGGMLFSFGEGRCWDVVVKLLGYMVVNVNNNFIRVRKNLGPKVILFNRVVRP